MPAYVTAENVKFNGTTDNAVVLRNSAGVRSLILWDKLSTLDQTILDTIITAYGGVTPLAGPTSGQHTLSFNGTVVGANATGLSNAAATAGYATINVGGAKSGASVSGLATAAGTQGYQVVNYSPSKTGASTTGLLNDTTAYTATIVVDGVSIPVSVVGSTAQTFTTLVAGINTALGSAAVASVTGGEIRVTSASFGTTSSVSITPGTLFPTVSGYIKVLPAANGGGAARQYSATVVVDGVVKTVRFTGLQGNTYTNVLTEINTDLGSAATATLNSGNIRITSATTGSGSSVAIYDTGFLFASLANYAGITSVAGTSPVTYTATITVDGADQAISIVGSAAQTFTALVAAINTALGVTATAAITSGNIVVTSASTGVTSIVKIVDNTLFKAVTGYDRVTASQPGAADLLSVLQSTRAANGTMLSNYFNIVTVGTKPAVPANTPHTTKFIYYNGSVWKYLDNDASV